MIRIIDLFAGIGGIRLGFEQAFGKEDIKCVFTSECNKPAIETYKANFGEENIYGDITKINASEIPDHDILLAGFPCQSFSVLGAKRGFNDQRGQLFFEIVKILKTKQPSVFLLENVPNLLSIEKGKVFEIIKTELQEAGYKISYTILSGKDFGVPQNRRRVYIVGYLDHKIDFVFPEPLNIKTSLGDILEKNWDSDCVLTDKKWNYYKERSERGRETLRNLVAIKIFNDKSEYARTLVAGYLHQSNHMLIENPGGNPRRLTPRECARLQGFPEAFVIDKVSKWQIYKQLGNSVCVPVIKAIANQIKKTFFKEIEK